MLNIQNTKTSPAHPQCNAQVKVFNKTVAKYLASFVSVSTLDWEQYIPALIFFIQYKLPLNNHDHTISISVWYQGSNPIFSQSRHPTILHYGKSFASERLQIVQHAKQIANEHATLKSHEYKDQFDN